MKYALLEYSHSNNIGDEIQSLAAKQHLPSVETLIDRDHTNEYRGDPVRLLMNGWFMAEPENWPPSAQIDPLFISFHISNYKNSNKILFSEENISYFKRISPIGCRDKTTLSYFRRHNIDAYYSGCLTLTLKNKCPIREDLIVLNDPFLRVDPRFHGILFDKLVPDSQKDKVVILNQDFILSDNSTENRFREAERYLDLYSRAKLVITSRIHCALPCLALGTPVYFVDVGYNSLESRDRFSGILDLFNSLDQSCIKYPRNRITDWLFRNLNVKNLCDVKNVQIDWDNPKINPVDIRPISDNLEERIAEFISS